MGEDWLEVLKGKMAKAWFLEVSEVERARGGEGGNRGLTGRASHRIALAQKVLGQGVEGECEGVPAE